METRALTPSQSSDSLHNPWRNADARTLTPTQSVDSLHKSPSSCLAPVPQLLEGVHETDVRVEVRDNGEHFLACELVQPECISGEQDALAEGIRKSIGQSLSSESLLSVESGSTALPPIPPQPSSVLDTRGVFRVISLQNAVSRHDILQPPTLAPQRRTYTTLNFEAGDIGFEAMWETGQITVVHAGSQCVLKGVEVGWKIAKVRGHPYTEDLLRQAIAGKYSFNMTFEINAEVVQDHAQWLQPSQFSQDVGHASSSASTTTVDAVDVDASIAEQEPRAESLARMRYGAGANESASKFVLARVATRLEEQQIVDIDESAHEHSEGADPPQPTWVIEEVIDFGSPYDDIPDLSSCDSSRGPMFERCVVGAFCYDEEPQLFSHRRNKQNRYGHDNSMCW